MTLFNVDKDGEGRLRPKVNAVDVHLNRKAHGTDSISPRAEGATGGGRVTTKNDRYMVFEDTTARIVIGILPDGTFGMAISKPGYDVITDCFV